MNSQWHQFLIDQGLTIDDRRGVGLSAQPGDGPIDLSHFGVLDFTGPDAVTFLQGYLTSDVDALAGAGAQFAAYLNLKGRVVSEFLVVAVDGGIQLTAHRSVLGAVARSLAKYLPFSRSRLTNLSDERVLFGLPGAARPTTLEARPEASGWCATLPDGREWLCLPLEAAQRAWLESATVAAPGDFRRWDLADVRGGIVHCQAATSERFLPQSLGLVDLGAVSFSKGCYLGQEVVARAQHRGQVKRVLVRYGWRGREPDVAETLETEDGADGGVVVGAAATSPDAGEALVVTHGAAETRLVGPGITLTVAPPGHAPQQTS